MKRVLSWGFGLQSTLLGVLSVMGVLPPLDLIIGSDLKFEGKKTYQIMKFYRKWFMDNGQTVVIVEPGDIRELGAASHVHIPFFTSNGGPLRRQCTPEFKIKPIRRYLRSWMGYPESKPPHPPKSSIEQWIGFTIDERIRMAHSGVQYINNRYPLIEMNIARWDCASWFEKWGLPVPGKSACLCCPYRKASEWLELKLEQPEEWDMAVEFDEKNRHNPLKSDGSTADALYIWQGSIPLSSVDLFSESEREKAVRHAQLGFNFEPVGCESGYCFI